MSLVQIEITNKCTMQCANCTRFIGHHKEPFFMKVDEWENAMKSLVDFPGNIGIMGGEPTLHPDFVGICNTLRKVIPDKRRRQLWTAGYKWDNYKDIIHETFDEDHIAFNNHKNEQASYHQPLLIAIDEVVEDKILMQAFIDNCWVQNRWSASITPKGAFYCEVAAAMDHLFDGPGGLPVEKGWWIKGIDCQDTAQYCLRCSAAMPVLEILSDKGNDYVSSGNFEEMALLSLPGLERCRAPDIEMLRNYLKGKSAEPGDEPGSLKDFPEWTPWRYRGKIWHKPEDSNTNGGNAS